MTNEELIEELYHKAHAKGFFHELHDKVVAWDVPPTEKYFAELKRVSKKQIIWGGNYFLDYLGATDGFLIRDVS